MPILVAETRNGNFCYRFKFWRKREIRLPEKIMTPLHGNAENAAVQRASLHFEKDLLWLQAAFVLPPGLSRDLHVSLEVGIRTAKESSLLIFGPFETEPAARGIELVRKIAIARTKLNPFSKSYPLKALDEIKITLGDYGGPAKFEIFSPLCEATFSRENKMWV